MNASRSGMLLAVLACLMLLQAVTAMEPLRGAQLNHEALHLFKDLSAVMHKREENPAPYRMRSCKAAEMAERRLRNMDARKMRIGRPPLIGDLKFLKKYCQMF